MAISAATIIKKVRDLIGDQDDTRHPDAELLEYLNEAQRAAVLIRPEVNPVTMSVPLEVGTKQEIPTDGFVFIGANRNMGNDGDTPGRAITPTDRENLDQTNPNWNMDPGVDIGDFRGVVNFVYDIRNRKTYYVYPYVPADTWQIEVVYAKPPDPATPGGSITVDDVYEPALVNYMLHRASSKDPASAEDAQKSMAYLANFTTLITGNADQKELELVVRHSPAEGTRGGS